MASVSSVSSTSSLYGNRNVITGLASGMDTESMIENMISGYKSKISALQQKRTKTEWKQEAYRSMINKMSLFSSKYASYMSSNNLMSASFFNNAVKTVAQGANASKVTATGRASSDIQINRVKQLATAATYTVSGSKVAAGTTDFGSDTVTATALEAMDLDGTTKVNGFSGNMTLAYGGSNALSYLSIKFDESKTYADAQELADEINKQLKTQTVNIGSSSYTGDELLNNVIKAEVKDGQITFADPKGNNVYISSASDSVKEKLLGGAELSTVADKQVKALTINDDSLKAEEVSTLQRLIDKGSMEITLDGVTKTIKIPSRADIAANVDPSYKYADALKKKIEDGSELTSDASKQLRDEAFMKALQEGIDDAFGKGKLTVSDANGGEAGIQLRFETAQKGSTIAVNSTYGRELGFGESKQATSYLNTGRTLGELLKEEDFASLKAVKDKDGNEAKDANGNTLYAFMVNDKEIGQFSKNSTLSDVMNAMNSSSDSEVKVGYSKMTNNLTFTAKETGADGPEGGIRFEGLAAKLFGIENASEAEEGYTAGQDAEFEVTVNGTTMNMKRSSNTVDMDGMSVTLKGTFGYEYSQNYDIKIGNNGFKATGSDDRLKLTTAGGSAVKYSTQAANLADFNGKEIYGKYVGNEMKFFVDDDKGNTKELFARQSESGVWFSINQDEDVKVAVTKGEAAATKISAEAVTFQTSSDADKIVDVVKKMVEDYNSMVTEIKTAYSTLPAQQSNGKYYEPMTSEEESQYSESYVKNWTEKAKQGILFGDRDLANLYSSLTDAVSMTGQFGATLRGAGITVSYSNGLSTLEFDENAFRAALDKDPDAVRDAFVSSTDAGSSANGLMAALKKPLDMYGKTSGGKGILVEKAGSPLAASTMYNNTIQQELDDIDNQISKWQDKVSSKVDYYTNQFSRLEQLINQMNAQSSYFSQLSGGWS